MMLIRRGKIAPANTAASWTPGSATALAALLSLFAPAAWADGRCDLDSLVGYQLMFARPIEGYIENAVRHKGYEGCQADRVLVFADNTGVRCKDVVLQHVDEDLPTGFLFGRGNRGDLKLCVEGELMDVSPTN
jgi:hypothetical protein